MVDQERPTIRPPLPGRPPRRQGGSPAFEERLRAIIAQREAGARAWRPQPAMIGRKSEGVIEFKLECSRSLSLLEAQDAEFHQLMEKIRDEQRQACLEYISEIAVTRVGPAGRQVEIGGLQIEHTVEFHMTDKEGKPFSHQHLRIFVEASEPVSGTYCPIHTISLEQYRQSINAEGALALQGSLELGEALAERGLTLGVDGEINELRKIVARVYATPIEDHPSGRTRRSWRR